eukprot:TRINITY_DN43681_c0_g1_i1.p1 TRINITY_DN43681_c0_g1~~TRINITY_DN43681_c0_g1_i1.p1  ORF type:complete len:143 (-),score=23.68 TRINITY_DN43681_c0_g1_i1:65-493(-)
MTEKTPQAATWEGLLRLFFQGIDTPAMEEIKRLKKRVYQLEALMGEGRNQPRSPGKKVAGQKPAKIPSQDGKTPKPSPISQAGENTEKDKRGAPGRLVLGIISDHSRGTNFKTIRAATGYDCLLYTSPSPRDRQKSRMPSSA